MNKLLIFIIVFASYFMLTICHSFEVQSALPTYTSSSPQVNKINQISIEPSLLINNNFQTSAVNTKNSAFHWLNNSILKSEVLLVGSLSLMFFITIFIYTSSKDIRDALVVNNFGVSVLPFIRLYVALPAIAAFIWIFQPYLYSMNITSSFYRMLAPFLIFFLTFGPILQWSCKKNTENTSNILIPLLSLVYYLVTELWGAIAIPSLFWTIANEVLTNDQAKKYHPLIVNIGNLSPILAGILIRKLTQSITFDGHSIDSTYATSKPFTPMDIIQSLAPFLTSFSWIQAGLCLGLSGLFYYITKILRPNSLYQKNKQSIPLSIPPPQSTEDSYQVQPPAQLLAEIYHRILQSICVFNNAENNIFENNDLRKSEPDNMSKERSLQYLYSYTIFSISSFTFLLELAEILWKQLIFKTVNNHPIAYLRFLSRQTTLISAFSLIGMLAFNQIWSTTKISLSTIQILSIIPVLLTIFSTPFLWSWQYFEFYQSQLTSNQLIYSSLLTIYCGLIYLAIGKTLKQTLFPMIKDQLYSQLIQQDDHLHMKQGVQKKLTYLCSLIDGFMVRLGNVSSAFGQQCLVILMFLSNFLSIHWLNSKFPWSQSLGSLVLLMGYYYLLFVWINKSTKVSNHINSLK